MITRLPLTRKDALTARAEGEGGGLGDEVLEAVGRAEPVAVSAADGDSVSIAVAEDEAVLVPVPLGDDVLLEEGVDVAEDDAVEVSGGDTDGELVTLAVEESDSLRVVELDAVMLVLGVTDAVLVALAEDDAVLDGVDEGDAELLGVSVAGDVCEDELVPVAELLAVDDAVVLALAVPVGEAEGDGVNVAELEPMRNSPASSA